MCFQGVVKAKTDCRGYEAVVSSVHEFQKEVVAYLLEVEVVAVFRCCCSRVWTVTSCVVCAYSSQRLKGTADSAKQMQKKRYQQPFLLSSR